MPVQNILSQMPPGYKFLPTDEELITHYLMNKVSDYESLPPHDFEDIDDDELHSKPPSNLVTYSCGEREWYFFIHEGEEFVKRSSNRIVGDGLGFWRANGQEQPVFNSDGNVFAFKTQFTYFSGSSQKNATKTHWRMEKYRLPNDQCHLEDCYCKGKEWVLGRLKRGMSYKNYF
ncbi:NAC domain-containing protein 72-like [Mercurialis annua]|uniref:NAC domain-containing protein 72-like n=1 Tax=Mercurialis annua TaxID=3986 RepID=UPI00215FB5C1|nr:NAC domain-containing protein 72-like [Mercurialis annua]